MCEIFSIPMGRIRFLIWNFDVELCNLFEKCLAFIFCVNLIASPVSVFLAVEQVRRIVCRPTNAPYIIVNYYPIIHS